MNDEVYIQCELSSSKILFQGKCLVIRELEEDHLSKRDAKNPTSQLHEIREMRCRKHQRYLAGYNANHIARI